ncbi:MAG: hypothetical protein ACK5Q7_05745 [Cyanobacteriota bacterium]
MQHHVAQVGFEGFGAELDRLAADAALLLLAVSWAVEGSVEAGVDRWLIEQEAAQLGGERLGAAGRVDPLGEGEQGALLLGREAGAVERFEHVLAIAAGAETEAGPQLPLEVVEERAPGIPTGAALGLGESLLQQAVLAQLQDLLLGLIALSGDGSHLLRRGLFHLAFAQLHLLLEDLLLAFGLLQAWSEHPIRAVLTAYCQGGGWASRRTLLTLPRRKVALPRVRRLIRRR